jgi:hypothetical protein
MPAMARGAHPAARGAQLEHVARVHPQALPGGHRSAVHGGRHVGAGDRDQPLVGELYARADQGALEPGRGVGIGDQAVGEDEGLAVHRPRGRDAHTQMAGPAQVLDGGERARVLDEQIAHDVVVTGPAIRGT